MNSSLQARRAFLRGQFKRSVSGLRPPWAQEQFIDLCTRCDDCINACDEGVIKRGDGGFPTMDFSQNGCTFCGDCRTSAKCQAFVKEPDATPWKNRITIGESCFSARGIVCRACGDICETRAIRFRLETGGKAIPVLEPSQCNGCGFCMPVCPENAITMETHQ